MASPDDHPRVLRIPHSDADNQAFVLLYIAPCGPSSLDLKLTATEGTQAYTGSIKQSRLGKLRAKNYDGDESEWATILSAVLLRKRVTNGGLQVMKGLETVASVNEANTLSITVRKDVGSIMQKLGTISMQHNEEAEIELFQWAGIACLSAAAAEDKIESIESKYHSQKNTIDRLSEQLEDLIKAKMEHENALLEKFSELLNTKKAKIREQQRLLDATEVKQDQVSRNSPANISNSSKKSAPRKSNKRKALVVEDPENDEAGSDKMDVDNGPLEESDGNASTTPDRTDEDTTTEDEDDAGQLQLNPLKSRLRAGDNGTMSAMGDRGSATQAGKRGEMAEVVAVPPPPRQLPFSNRLPAKKEDHTTPIDDDEETDDDDEL